jgi:hypothetical protein
MRAPVRFVLFGPVLVLVSVLTAPAADEPAPLLKAVTPPAKNLRVRIPVTPGSPLPMKFNAQVPRAKKKSELIDIVVTYDTFHNPNWITLKKLESWGYEPGKATEFILPELLIPASQVSPKVAKDAGADVLVKLTNIKLTVVNNPASTNDTIHTADMTLSALGMFQNAEQTVSPRISFGDKFIEMTVPSTSVKRSGTDAIIVSDVTISKDAKLVPSVAHTVVRNNMPAIVYAAIDGQDAYKTPEGRLIPVNCAVSSISNNGVDGIMVTLGLARGVKLEMDPAGKGPVALGVDIKTEFAPGKIKELRLGLHTGPGYKVQKDLVIKDVPVYVDKNITDGYMYINQKFMDQYMVDAVYTSSGDGWKLYGRCDPDLLFDIKTRPKPVK